jgi:hypothetical protein
MRRAVHPNCAACDEQLYNRHTTANMYGAADRQMLRHLHELVTPRIAKCSVLIALSAATTAVVMLLLVSPTSDSAALQGPRDVATLALADAQCSVHTH